MGELPKAAQGTFDELLAAVLANPDRLLEGTGKGLRHVKRR